MFRKTRAKGKTAENNELVKARTAIKRQIDRLNNYRDAMAQSQAAPMDSRQQLVATILAQARDGSMGLPAKPRDLSDIEIIYDIQVHKKPKHSIHVKAKKDRHLAISLIQSQNIALIHYYNLTPTKNKESQLELQQTWLLSDIVAVDFGEGCEVVFTFDAPYSYFTATPIERDETVWIVLNLCEAVCKFRPQTSADNDILGFTATANNFLAQHPILQKYMAKSSMAVRNAARPEVALLEEENEAEDVLTNLSWQDHNAVELAAMLRQQQENLQRDNIEFLLEWEELGDDGEDPTRGSRATMATPGYFRPLRFGQTELLLSALDDLDTELGDLDHWLETQVDHLSEVQHELKRIEDENNTLETQWHNFSRLKGAVEHIVHNLRLPVEQEHLLMSPERPLELAFHMPNFNETTVFLQPLADAMQRLHDALFRSDTSTEGAIASWLQLGTLAAVREQEEKLQNLSVACCDRLGNSLQHVFKRILDHPALDDERTGATVKVKGFDFSTILDHNNRPTSSHLDPQTQLVTAQKLYHSVLNDFIPLVDGLISLDATWLPTLKAAYVQTSADSLYTPLLKQYFKDLQGQIPKTSSRSGRNHPSRFDNLSSSLDSSPRPSELSSTSSGRPPLKSSFSILFGGPTEAESTTSIITSAFELCLTHARVVMEKEERFISGLFATYSEENETPLAQMEIMFAGFKNRLLRFVSTDVYVEGLDLLSLLRTIDEVFRDDNNTDPAATHPFRSEFLGGLLVEVKVILTRRFNEFILQQEQWIAGHRADTKRGGVLAPFLKFPVLVDLIERTINGHRIEAVVTAYQKLCTALFSWLERLSSQNVKYSDSVRIVNYEYFVQTIGTKSIPTLQRFIEQAITAKAEAQTRYVRWMVQYELPQLVALMDRIEEVADGHGEAAVGIYIKKDVVTGVSRATEKSIRECIGNIHQRLRKHFVNDGELAIIEELWKAIQKYLVRRYRRYEAIMNAAYQMRIAPTTPQVEEMLRAVAGV